VLAAVGVDEAEGVQAAVVGGGEAGRGGERGHALLDGYARLRMLGEIGTELLGVRVTGFRVRDPGLVNARKSSGVRNQEDDQGYRDYVSCIPARQVNLTAMPRPRDGMGVRRLGVAAGVRESGSWPRPGPPADGRRGRAWRLRASA